MRTSLCRALLAVAFAVCAQSVVPAHAAEPAANGTPGICPISVNVSAIREHPGTVAFTLWADDKAGLASGDIVAYAGTNRYRIPFIDALAGDVRDATHVPTVIVVRFDKATPIASAYVGTLDGAACAPHRPYVDASLERDRPDLSAYRIERAGPEWANILRKPTADATPRTAPEPVVEELPTCARPYVATRLTENSPLGKPAGVPFAGALIVALSIDPAGAVSGARMVVASRYPRYNEAAVKAALESKYAAQIYRCSPVAGSFSYIAIFAGSQS